MFSNALNNLETCMSKLESMGKHGAAISAPTPILTEISGDPVSQGEEGSELRVPDEMNYPIAS